MGPYVKGCHKCCQPTKSKGQVFANSTPCWSQESCSRFLFSLLSETNTPLLIDLAERYDCIVMRQKLGLHVAQSFELLVETGEAWSLSPEIWEQVLQMDELAASQNTLPKRSCGSYFDFLTAGSLPVHLDACR